MSALRFCLVSLFAFLCAACGDGKSSVQPDHGAKGITKVAPAPATARLAADEPGAGDSPPTAPVNRSDEFLELSILEGADGGGRVRVRARISGNVPGIYRIETLAAPHAAFESGGTESRFRREAGAPPRDEHILVEPAVGKATGLQVRLTIGNDFGDAIYSVERTIPIPPRDEVNRD